MYRSAFIDLVKILAAQVIVLHHMVLYTPMSPVLASWAPELLDWLARDGKRAVQLFLVIGGYLAHQSLSAKASIELPRLLRQRFFRLAILLWIALLLVLLGSLVFGHWLTGQTWFSPLPSPLTFAAHLLLLQDVLGIPSISAGAWYVAIDLQLYALSAALMLAAQRWPRWRVLLQTVMPILAVIASAAVWSQDAELEAWAPYFYFAYGLGWLASSARAQRISPGLLGAVALGVGLYGLHIGDPLPPLASAFALLMFALAHRPWPHDGPLLRALRVLSDRSHALFVSHYAVILVFSGLWLSTQATGLGAALAMSALTWWGANRCARWLHPIGERLLHWRPSL